MQIRDRVKELRRVRASELRPHPQNWRLHPPQQHDALRGILAEVGFAGALLVRELADGALEILDGHLRAEVTPTELVPVLVLDVNAEEAAKLLATHDAITSLALPDLSQLAALVEECHFEHPALDAMFRQLQEQGAANDEHDSPPATSSAALAESYQVVAACRDEAEQQALFERLTREGFRCRVLML